MLRSELCIKLLPQKSYRSIKKHLELANRKSLIFHQDNARWNAHSVYTSWYRLAGVPYHTTHTHLTLHLQVTIYFSCFKDHFDVLILMFDLLPSINSDIIWINEYYCLLKTQFRCLLLIFFQDINTEFIFRKWLLL